MTFEIAFTYQGIPFEADVTDSGNDLLVNFTSPAQYEGYPTLVFTRHPDGSMAFDDHMFSDKEFLPAVAAQIGKHLPAGK